MRFVLVILAFLVHAASAHAQSTEIVGDKTIGVAVGKPVEWQNLTTEQAIENFQNVDVDENIREAAAKPGGLPLITFIKYPVSYPGVNPTFKVSLHTNPKLAGLSARDILAITMRALKTLFPDLAVQEGPTETSVSGMPAAYGRMNYTLSISDAPYPTTSEVWIIPRGDSYFMIGAGTRTDEANGTRAEMRPILDSVRIEPRL